MGQAAEEPDPPGQNGEGLGHRGGVLPVEGGTRVHQKRPVPPGKGDRQRLSSGVEDGEEPAKGIQLMWCILLILLPIALLFAESSMNSLQSVSIVAAFPIGIVIVMIAVSFLKDAKLYLEELQGGKAHVEEKKEKR